MVDPGRLPGVHSIFLCGNDAGAKNTVRQLLEGFGWKDIIDLGDIKTAAGAEAYLSLWLPLWKALGTTNFNIQVVR
jgi:predicted dinucleotide-binding enzyme